MSGNVGGSRCHCSGGMRKLLDRDERVEVVGCVGDEVED